MERNAANLDALRKGLRDLGYIEGQNLVLEYRSSDGRAERFPDLASELVRLKVDLIVARGTPATNAAKNATPSVPVVMATMGAPGTLVASFAQPGGNITGVTTFSTELTAKRIEILKELAPKVSRIGLFHNMGNPAVPPEWEETKAAARSLGLEAELLDVRNGEDIGRAFELAVRQHVDALVVGADGLIQAHQQTIVNFAARHRLPAVYPSREFIEAGGLIAYAVNYPDLYFRFASFVDKILRGDRVRRREVLAGIAGAAARPSLAWSQATRAQPLRTTPARIGVLQWGRQTAASLDQIEVLRHELNQLGYVEDRDIELDIRFAQESDERAAAIATEFVRRKIDVIVAGATPSVHAAKAATQDIPIVMSNVADPLATCLVKSLSRPGGNITGVTFTGPHVAPKRKRCAEIAAGLIAYRLLERLAIPTRRRFCGSRVGGRRDWRDTYPVLVNGLADFTGAFAEFAAHGGTVLVQPLFIIDHSAEIAELALEHRLPTISVEARYARQAGSCPMGWSGSGSRAARRTSSTRF